MGGRLIVIEGLDGSGKGTQAAMLCEALSARGLPVRKVSFPNYDSPSSAIVKMYLGGDFGADAGSVNPYTASSNRAQNTELRAQTKTKRFWLKI